MDCASTMYTAHLPINTLHSLLHVLLQLQLGDALALGGEDGGERGGVDVFDS